MRKFFKRCASLLALSVLTVTGYVSANAAPVTMGQEYTVGMFETFTGQITVASAGNLTVELNSVANVDDCELTNESGDVINYTKAGWNAEDTGKECVYSLSAAGTYNFTYSNFFGTETVTFKCSFDSNGGSDQPGTGGGNTGNDGDLPVPATNFTLSKDLYTYTPATNGVLTIEYQNMPYDNCLYSSWGNDRMKVALEDGIDPNTAKVFKWTLQGGHTYYLDASYPANNVVTTSFVSTGGGNQGGGDDDPDPTPTPPEVPEGWSQVVMGQEYSVAPGETLKLYFYPENDGVLKLNQWGETDTYLRTAPDEDFIGNFQPGEYMGSDPAEYTYELEGGKVYYYYAVNSPNSAPYVGITKVEFVSFESDSQGGGGGTIDPGNGEIPEGWDPMEMNKTYTASGVGSLKLAINPTASGTLKVVQTGSFDTHLFVEQPVYDATYGYDNNYGIMATPQGGGYEGEGTGIYTMRYGLAAGQTYYYVGTLMNGDALKTVEFEYEGVDDNNVVILGTPYIFNEKTPTYTFTPEETGQLSVAWSNPSPTGDPAFSTEIVWGSDQYFLWNDPGLSDPVPTTNVGNGPKGWEVFFNVVAGTTYYVHLNSGYGWQAEFSMAGEAMEPSILTINPTPGKAYDIVNYRYYWNIQTAPNAASVERVTLTYVAANSGEETTIELKQQPEMGGSVLQVPADEIVSLLENGEVAPESDLTFTLYGMKAGGAYVTQNKLVNGEDYVTIGENGLVTVTYSYGTPVDVVKIDLPNPWKKAWERGDKEGIGTIEFTGDIYNIASITVLEGHQYYGSEGGEAAVYSVTVPNQNVTIDGNIVTIDFTNINYNMPAGTTEVSVFIEGIMGTNGLYGSFDGYPVYQYYAAYSATGADLPEDILTTVEPRAEATFGGFEADESIVIELSSSINDKNPTTVQGEISDEDGEVIAGFDFLYRSVNNTWYYIFPEGTHIVFEKGKEYMLTVNVFNADNTLLGTQNVYWIGTSEESGVASILGGENGVYNVYSIDGVKVLSTEKASDLNNLESGRLYIINGKKVIIRK